MIRQFFKHPQIQVALAAGICIVVQAWMYKKVYHLELDTLLVGLPAFLFAIFGVISTRSEKDKEKHSEKPLAKPVYWILAIILATAVTLVAPLID